MNAGNAALQILLTIEILDYDFSDANILHKFSYTPE